MHPNPLIACLGTAALAGCVSVAPESEMRPAGSPGSIEISLEPNQLLELRVPAGEVSIVGTDARRVRASLSIECPAESEKCARWADEAGLRTARDRERVRVVLDAPVRFNASVRLHVEAPRHNPLNIVMGYGELRAEGIEDDLRVAMKAGDVDIVMPRDAVGDVRLAARFGDVSMSVDDRAVEGRRPWLVGAKLDWQEGHGDHDVDVRLRYGDVHVALQR